MEHEMYIMQVKKPEESKYPWDYYKLVQTMSGEQAFGKLADSACPLGHALSVERALHGGARPLPRPLGRDLEAISPA